MTSRILRVDPLRSTDFGSITASYVALGAAFSHTTRMVRFVNTTNALLLISFDGTTDNFVLPAGSFVLYDGTANKEENAGTFVFVIGTQPYVKYSGSAPTSGTIYLEAIHGLGE
jgi:hypothetical protein